MIRLEDVLKMSWGRFSRRLEDVLGTSSKRLEDILQMSWRRFYKKFWRRLEDVLKTYSQDGYIGLDQDVRLRRTYLSWSRRLLKTKTKDVFKVSSRRHHQDERLLCNSNEGISLRSVLTVLVNTFYFYFIL